MSVLSTVLLVLGILMLIEGATAVLFPKFSLKMSGIFRRFMKSVEKNLRVWGIGEIIAAIILIIISTKL